MIRRILLFLRDFCGSSKGCQVEKQRKYLGIRMSVAVITLENTIWLRGKLTFDSFSIELKFRTHTDPEQKEELLGSDAGKPQGPLENNFMLQNRKIPKDRTKKRLYHLCVMAIFSSRFNNQVNMSGRSRGKDRSVLLNASKKMSFYSFQPRYKSREKEYNALRPDKDCRTLWF